jgi:hypothetical protein
MTAKRIRSKKGGRLHLRVAAEIEVRMHDYAKRHHTNLTSIVTKYFLELLAAEEAPRVPEAEQI